MTDRELSPPEIIVDEPGALMKAPEQPPTVLPAVILEDVVPFPGPLAPVLVEDERRRDAILHAKSNAGFVLLINRQPPLPGALPKPTVDDEVDAPSTRGPLVQTLGELVPVGVVGRVIKVFRMPDDRSAALVQLVRRATPIELLKREPFPVVRCLFPAEVSSKRADSEAVLRQLKANLATFFDEHEQAPTELKMAAAALDEPSVLADFVGQHLARDVREKLELLSELDITRRVRRALELTLREVELQTLGNRISKEIRDKVDKSQRDFFLREQLRAIRRELGEEKEPALAAIDELAQKLSGAALPPMVRERADAELSRLRMIPTESPEHNVVRSYLDWIVALPWGKSSVDTKDIRRARAVLDEDHYGLQEVKERILEFLAVRQLNPKSSGTILCLAGPPGVGKTSLGQSIARALGRPFFRFAVGGMRDEAEIKGHRRTYVGAMPGRILQGLKQAGANDPVFMLDEIDKMGSDWRGDPSSAMLEVLDPAQNGTFTDHYLDLPFDLSRVMFIATANVKSEIPVPLLDRMEVIDLAGYIPEEKLEIATRHLLPRQRKAHGLTLRQLRVGKPAIARIITRYTSEAGVRELERQLGKLCRKRAMGVVEGKKAGVSIAPEQLKTWLGPPRITEDTLLDKPRPGIATGLAWTAVGGDILFIEATQMDGKGEAKVTGQLGEVMSESVTLAQSYVRAHAEALGIDPAVFKSKDFHVHFPAGAVKKDGPSAGITVTTALVSLLVGKAIRPKLAMTGEMTLRGEVLPVGGIREKIVAARRAGVRTVILPERNRPDVDEIPAEVKAKVEFVFVAHYDEVLAAALGALRRPLVRLDRERVHPRSSRLSAARR